MCVRNSTYLFGIRVIGHFIWSNLNPTALKVKKVLISQPQPTTGKSPYFDLAEKYGVEFVFKPFIRVEPLTAKEFRQQHVNILDHTAVVFTSRHAVDHFFQLCAEMRITIPEDMLAPTNPVFPEQIVAISQEHKIRLYKGEHLA